MEKMKDLRDLLKHEIKDLYSAEEQIIQAMPRMIEKAKNPQLKEALQMHLQITEEQLNRLEQVQQLLQEEESGQGGNNTGTQEGGKEGLFTRLLRKRTEGNAETGTGGEQCRGMRGLIEEGEKVMAEDMEPSVMDAAIIACAQKIEHYEICGYGTARAFARELNLGQVAELLEETLDEEYEADDRLTDMAVGRLNEEAEKGRSRSRTTVSSKGRLTKTGSSSSRSGGRSASGNTSRSRSAAKATASNSRSGSSSGRSASSSSSGRGGSSSGRSSSTTGRTKSAAKASSGRSGGGAPAKKTSNTRSTAKSSGRGASTGNTRSASASRSGKAPSKAAAAKGGRNSSGGGRSGSTGRGRGGSNGRSSGR